MPLDASWWDPGGPFADNETGGITAEVMRNFAQAVSAALSDEWFEIDFATPAITQADWTTPSLAKVLWLKKVTAWQHSEAWVYGTDGSLLDCFSYLNPESVSLQFSFNPSHIVVSHATIGTTMTPVVSLTPNTLVDPDPSSTFVVGPTSTITTTSPQDIDVGGRSSILLATTERTVRFGLRFTPLAGSGIGTGGAFNVDPTNCGAAVGTRSLAPGV